MDDIPFDPQWSVDTAESALAHATSLETESSIPIVIAEDDPVSRKLVDAVIRDAGFRTMVTQNGYEAMSVIRAETGSSIAVLDWMMPGMDGGEVCRRIREGNRPVYIIMLTARSGKGDTVEGLDGGADDYLVKPFNQAELLARIRVGMRALDRHARKDLQLASLEERARGDQPGRLEIPL